MAATSGLVRRQLTECWSTRRVPIAALQLMEGWLLQYDESASGDPVIECEDTADDKFAGIAMETVDNTTGGLGLGAGNAYIKVCTAGKAIVELSTTPALADLGASVFAIDGDTVSLAAGATNDVYVGFISQWENVADPHSRTNAVEITFGRDNRD